MKEKIVFFGSGPYVDGIIEILKREFDVVRIVSSKEKFTEELFNELRSYDVKVAILASFGQIIPSTVLNMFPLGIINIHPSLLPKYRGPTPVQTAILNGDQSTGVSIMKLDEQVDHGPILAQIEAKIEQNDTSESLYTRLFELGANEIVKMLPKYISGDLKLSEQNHANATFTEHLTRKSGEINLDELRSNEELDRMIRAYYPWPGVWFIARSPMNANSKLNNKVVKLLPEGKIQVEGKNAMPMKDFLNGYPEGKEILEKLNLT